MRHHSHNHKRKLQKSIAYLSSGNQKPKDGRCTQCGLIKPLTRHHKIPRSDNGPNALTNIEWLCRDCHDGRHGMVKKEHKDNRTVPEKIMDRMEGNNDFADQ